MKNTDPAFTRLLCFALVVKTTYQLQTHLFLVSLYFQNICAKKSVSFFRTRQCFVIFSGSVGNHLTPKWFFIKPSFKFSISRFFGPRLPVPISCASRRISCDYFRLRHDPGDAQFYEWFCSLAVRIMQDFFKIKTTAVLEFWNHFVCNIFTQEFAYKFPNDKIEVRWVAKIDGIWSQMSYTLWRREGKYPDLMTFRSAQNPQTCNTRSGVIFDPRILRLTVDQPNMRDK